MFRRQVVLLWRRAWFARTNIEFLSRDGCCFFANRWDFSGDEWFLSGDRWFFSDDVRVLRESMFAFLPATGGAFSTTGDFARIAVWFLSGDGWLFTRRPLGLFWRRVAPFRRQVVLF